MKAKTSAIGNVKGFGMAQVGSGRGSLEKCTGYMVVDDEASALGLMNAKGLTFSGPVYDNGSETQLTFPIMITHTQDGRIEFSATGNPYEQDS